MLKKQGQEVNDAGQVVQTRTPKKANDSAGSGSGGRVTERGGSSEDGGGRRRRPDPSAAEERTRPVQFLREVRSEIRKVNWPNRSEVINYSLVVLFTVVFLTVLIGLLDWLFSISLLELFNT